MIKLINWWLILAPPSYAECLFMEQADIHDAEDDQHLMGNLSYRPMYPTYATLREASMPSGFAITSSSASSYPEKV